MKKAKKSIYVRYEFTNEQGKMEGGDILQFPTIKAAQAIATEILSVAHSDGVAVNITIGEEKPFFGFLKNAGMSPKQVAEEIVIVESEPSSKKKPSKKPAKKARKK